MKSRIAVASILLLTALLVLFAVANQEGVSSPLSGRLTGTSTSSGTLPNDLPIPDRRTELLAEIHRIEEEYNLLVATMQSQLVETPFALASPLAFATIDVSTASLYSTWDDLVGRVQSLNEDYFSLFAGDSHPPAIPLPAIRPNTEAEIDALLADAGADYQHWLEQEARTGSFISLALDPYEGRPQIILIGDSYVEERLHWQAILDFRLALTAPPLDQQLQEILAIQLLFPGTVKLVDVGKLLPPYTSEDLHEYRTGTWRVIFRPSTIQIMLIDKSAPVQDSRHDEMFTCTGLTAQVLNAQANAFIRRAAPRIDVASLTPVLNQKGDNFFFRWEDRTRPLLPDGRSYPFVQVTIDVCGNLLNYYNTL